MMLDDEQILNERLAKTLKIKEIEETTEISSLRESLLEKQQ